MASLISTFSTSGGKRSIRSCNAVCYDAKKPECNCVCGGKNHGLGLQKAIDNTIEMAKALVKQFEDVKTLKIYDPEKKKSVKVEKKETK